jgi:glutaredoxin-related protein
MKKLFKSFVNPDLKTIEKAWKGEGTIFVFDTNVFLNLYGYAEQTRSDFFDVVSKIKSKVWIPYQVGLEYHRRRLTVIKNEKKVFRDIEAILEKIPEGVDQSLKEYAMWKKVPELDVHLQELVGNIRKEVDECKKKVSEWDKMQPDVRSSDFILDKIDELTEGKIGPAPESQDWLDSLYVDGEVRYKNKIPPGFEDRSKGKGEAEEAVFFYNDLSYQRKFGDLIMWMQLIDKANQDDVKNIVFVTDDAKKDWWSIIDSGGKKVIGPHEGLKSEMHRKTNVNFFHMYTTSDFLQESKSVLKANIQQSSIEDAHDKNEIVLNFYNDGGLIERQPSLEEYRIDPFKYFDILDDKQKRAEKLLKSKRYWNVLGESAKASLTTKEIHDYLSDDYFKDSVAEGSASVSAAEKHLINREALERARKLHERIEFTLRQKELSEIERYFTDWSEKKVKDSESDDGE